MDLDPIVAVYTVKLTARSAQMPNHGRRIERTVEATGELLAGTLRDSISEETGATDVVVNVTSIERTDD